MLDQRVENKLAHPPPSEPQILIHKIKAAGLDGLDVKARKSITPGFARSIHEAGLKLYVWTVDSPRIAKTLAHAGVDGITTNRPGWLREKLAA